MSRPLPLMGKTHPLTGEPIRAIGFRPDGRPVWPIMGGDASNDPPERPDDVSEEEWDALGDPGKQALVRERGKVADLERQLAAAKARPAPPKKPAAAGVGQQQSGPGQQQTDGAGGGDVEALIKAAVDAAIKPFTEREQRRDAEAAAQQVRDAVVTAAKDRLHDGTDGLMIDLAAVVSDDGTPDTAKINAALDALVKDKPHLAKDPRRFGAPGVGPTVGGADVPLKDRVQTVLAQMQTATGIRAPKSE